VARAQGKCQIIAGTGANCTREAIEMTKRAKEDGADATLQVTPYYNKPTQEGLYRHFSEIADKGGLPVVLYNVPGRAGVPIAETTVARLAKNAMIPAIKEAGGSVDRVSAIKDLCDITVLSGDDSLTLPMMAVGADGIISVASNVAPKQMADFIGAIREGDMAKAETLNKELTPLFTNCFVESNPIPAKAAMAAMGLIENELRLPLVPSQQKTYDLMVETIKPLGLL
jgi:4-hydroxy-tetrahydrodipicolinate synthase